MRIHKDSDQGASPARGEGLPKGLESEGRN